MKKFISIGAFSAGLAVLIGAFGAHALKDKLGVYELSVFETGSKYHFYHSLALIAYGALGKRSHVGILFLLGIIIFSGSLYLLAILGIKKLGMITPIGGTLFILAWIRFGLEFLGKETNANR